MIKRYITLISVVIFVVISFFCNCVVGSNWAQRKPISTNLLKTDFAEPDMAYAPFAFWFWDKSLDANQITNMAEEMCKQHMNPGYVHGRWGLPADQWVTDKWFDCFSKAAEVAEKNKYYIGYCDEYSWPSGQALGRVLEKNPELKAVSLRWAVQDIKGPSEVKLPFSFFTVAAKKADPLDSSGWPIKIEYDSITIIGSGDEFYYSVPEGTWRIYTFNKEFHAGMDGSNVNYLDRRLPEVFLGLVHEKYAEHLKGELGKTVTGVFVDNEGDYGWKLAWSDDLDKEFKQKTGTDIRLIMPLMIDEDTRGVFAKARWDWYEAVSVIYSESYLGKVSEWAEKHNMYTISNLWESNCIFKKYPNLIFQAYAVGDFFMAQRSVTMPGNDCLIDKPYQIYDFKETQSVCEFENRRFMSETLGGSGWQMTPATMKKSANSIIAFGVNHVVPHGINFNRQLNTIPYPPDWFNENPYWRSFHLWSDFVRRASYVNSQGRMDPDVLLLNPMDSVWALYGGGIFEFNQWDFYSLTNTGQKADLDKIEEIYYYAVNHLQDARIEYLVTDRYYLRKMKLKENGRLTYEDFEFKTIVLPHLVVLPLDVAEKILNFAKKGGYVYALGGLPGGSTDNGLNDPKMQAMMAELEKLPSFKKTDKGINGLLAENVVGLKSPVEFEKGEFKMMQQHRKIDGRDFFWLVNNTDNSQDCVLKVKNVKGRASIWDCETGEIKDVASKLAGDGETLNASFAPCQAYWLVFDPSQNTLEGSTEPLQWKTIANLDGMWNVKVNVNDQPVRVADDQNNFVPDSFIQQQGDNKELADWNLWGLDTFSGFVDYTKTFDCDSTDGKIILDLGKVYYTAELWINDKKVGEKIWPPFEFDITDYVKNGSNKLFVRIGNTIYNTMRQYKGMNNACLDWTVVTEEEKISGLFGPVAIKKR
ncbi:MAG TPA: glycosyl hydrolase [Sedimentisphaerales bacterium]|nr:glycosyl hydrolase [Sedimentisphaerales bacterium]